jgi:hypothetical protein
MAQPGERSDKSNGGNGLIECQFQKNGFPFSLNRNDSEIETQEHLKIIYDEQ